jgi:hypothetical protein
MRHLTFTLVIISFAIQSAFLPAKGQIRDFGNFVVGGADDAEKLFTAYMSPYINGFAASLTGGWYNTAKPHKLGGFDLTITINSAFVPDEFKTFDVDGLDLTSLSRIDGSETLSPTGAGKNDAGPDMKYNYAGFDSAAFTLPPGTGIGLVPSGMIQAGIGLFKGTELIGRYLPKVGYKKGKAGLWGVGLKHDIKQWIPGLNKVPVLNISVMGGYTAMNSFVSLSVTPERLNLADYYSGADVWNDQKMVLTSSSFTANLVVSADLPIVCFYGGVGFATTKTNFKLQGNYPMIDHIETTSVPPVPVVEAVADPINFEISNKEGTKTKPRLNAGVRLKLALLTLQFDYTRAKYNMATFGIGLSFR